MSKAESSIVAPIAGAIRPKSANRDFSKHKLKILLVEDDEGDAYLIISALSDNPRVESVVVAKNGDEALELIDRGAVKPDLALIDLHMPRKDGLALLTHLALRKGDWFPSVVLTSSRLKADALRSQTRGAVGFVTKPMSVAKLKEALNREIERV
jgi:CheY-like chemotaxis protein